MRPCGRDCFEIWQGCQRRFTGQHSDWDFRQQQKLITGWVSLCCPEQALTDGNRTRRTRVIQVGGREGGNRTERSKFSGRVCWGCEKGRSQSREKIFSLGTVGGEQHKNFQNQRGTR